MPGTFPLDLSGRRVRLREFSADDLDAVVAIVGDDRVTTFLSFDSKTRDQAEAMLADILERARTEFYLAVEPLAGLPLVGFIRLALGRVRAAKLGYAIHADHWGRGYATDAVRTTPTVGFVDKPTQIAGLGVGLSTSRRIADGSGMIGR